MWFEVWSALEKATVWLLRFCHLDTYCQPRKAEMFGLKLPGWHVSVNLLQSMHTRPSGPGIRVFWPSGLLFSLVVVGAKPGPWFPTPLSWRPQSGWRRWVSQFGHRCSASECDFSTQQRSLVLKQLRNEGLASITYRGCALELKYCLNANECSQLKVETNRLEKMFRSNL